MAYLHQKIEKKWQEYWIKNNTFFTNLLDKNKPKKYILAMFPYPSGNGLHVGHIRNYTIADVLARFYRLNGYNVLLPIGWDAFGLPAEQYAIQTGNHPATFTNNNIQNFKEQLLKIGFSYDWSKEINTSDPNYYHWTQWIFKQIYLQKLAEYKKIPVYWCEKLGTVLANEEIKLVNGQKVSERGSYAVIQKFIPQWVLKITNYAEKLLVDLQQVDWPNSIKSLQTNWIGLSQGTLIDFSIIGRSEKITIFTTRSDTIYGVVALALSPNHPTISTITLSEKRLEVNNFCNYWKEHINNNNQNEIEGIFTGSYCLNPINNEKVPIWITNYVLPECGTGAVMVCPNCSLIDNKFAEKYNFDWKIILCPFPEKQMDGGIALFASFYDGEINGNYKYVLSPLIKNITSQENATEIINNHLEKINQGKKHNTYHLRDWIFSRQRYWGEPIPIIHWEDNQQELLKDEELPLKLPPLTDFTPSKFYYSPLQKIDSWVNLKRDDGISGKRDLNIMPQWAGSCWYYIAFLLKKNDGYLALDSEEAKEIIKHWLPVDLYIGGQEHANLHLLYARFWHKVLNKIGIVYQSEPFQKLLCQGMILGSDGEKMSKSRGNVVNPNDLVEKYGADALRLYEVFLGPVEQTTKFDSTGVRAMKKWLDRVYNFFLEYCETILTNIPNQEIESAYQEMIIKSTEHYKNIKLNLVVSSLMTFINKCYKSEAKFMPTDCFLDFLKILNPLAPHLSEEIWSFFQKNPITDSDWPQPKKLQTNLSQKVNIVVQINGQKKIIISVNRDESQAVIEKIIKNDSKLNKLLEKQIISKTIFIKNKLINFVIN